MFHYLRLVQGLVIVAECYWNKGWAIFVEDEAFVSVCGKG